MNHHSSDGDQDDLHTLHQELTALQQERDALQGEVARLRTERDSLRLLADFSCDWDFWITPDGSYRYISPACEQITGYPPEVFQHDPHLLKRLVHPEDREHVLRHLTDEVPRQKPHTLTFRIITRSGEERWIEHVCQPVYGNDGTWLGQRASNRDMTLTMQTEASLREEQQRFARGPVVIISWEEREGWPVYAISPNITQFGYTPADFTSRRIAYQDIIHPDDRARVQAEIQRLRATNAPPLTRQDYRLVCADGTVRHVADFSRLIYDRDGNIVRIDGYLLDVTEQKQVEEELRAIEARYRTLVNHFPDGVVLLFDQDMRYLVAGGQQLDRVGMTSSMLEGKTLWEVNPAEIAEIGAPLYRAILEGNAPAEVEQHYGEYIYRTQPVSLRNAQGEVIGGMIISQDITERKRAEAALHASEARFRTLIDHLPDSTVFLVDHDLRFLVARGQGLTRMGWDPDALEGKTVQACLPPATYASVAPIYQAALAGTAPSELEQTWRDHTYLLRPVSLHNEQGKVIAAMLLVQDITARKRAEATLQASEARHRAMFERNRAVKLLIDPATGAIVDANPAASDFYGYPLDTMRSLNITDLNVLEPAEIQAAMQHAQNEECLCFLFQHRLASGALRDVEVHSSPLEIAGKQVLFSIVHDITERKEAEDKLQRQRQFLRQVIDTTPALIFARDRAGHFTLVNQTLADIYNTTVEDLLGKTDADMNLDAAELAKIRQEDAQVLTTGADLIIPERRITDAKGQTRFMTIVKRLLYGADEPADQVLVVATDITERKQGEMQLQRANGRLLESNEQLQQRTCEVVKLNQMGDNLQRCTKLEAAYAVIATSAEKLFEGQAGALYIRRESTTLFDAVACWGDSPPAEPTVEQSACQALQTHQLAVSSRASNRRCAHLASCNAAAALCVPLIVQDTLLGMIHICISSAKEHEAQQHWRQLADTVSQQVSLALNNLALREQLQQQAIRDSLTGLYNRRYLDETLPRELQRAKRYDQPVGVMMLDIDHFKRFNDSYGHDAGDTLLRAVGAFLQRTTRGADIACRYGGEEFTLVLPGATLEDTRQRAEEIRGGIETLKVEHQGQWLGTITISLGVSVFPEHSSTADGVVRSADQALYQAKRSGRNRVVVAENTPEYARSTVESSRRPAQR